MRRASRSGSPGLFAQRLGQLGQQPLDLRNKTGLHRRAHRGEAGLRPRDLPGEFVAVGRQQRHGGLVVERVVAPEIVVDRGEQDFVRGHDRPLQHIHWRLGRA